MKTAKTAVLMMGRLPPKSRSHEMYQVVLAMDSVSYSSAIYDGALERSVFYDQVGDQFVERILAAKGTNPMEIQVINGGVINPQTGRTEKIEKLDDRLRKIFRDCIVGKLDMKGYYHIPLPRKFD